MTRLNEKNENVSMTTDVKEALLAQMPTVPHGNNNGGSLIGKLNTLHDRYFCHPIYAAILKPVLKSAYINYMTHNSIEDNFKNNPEIIEALKEIRENNKLFDVEDLRNNIHPAFVKH